MDIAIRVVGGVDGGCSVRVGIELSLSNTPQTVKDSSRDLTQGSSYRLRVDRLQGQRCLRAARAAYISITISCCPAVRTRDKPGSVHGIVRESGNLGIEILRRSYGAGA